MQWFSCTQKNVRCPYYLLDKVHNHECINRLNIYATGLENSPNWQPASHVITGATPLPRTEQSLRNCAEPRGGNELNNQRSYTLMEGDNVTGVALCTTV